MNDTTDTTEGADDGADFAALDAIADEAQALEGAADAKQAQAETKRAEVEQQSAAAELRGALEMVRMIAAPALAWWPQFGQVWGDSQLDGISDAGAAVMQRHGWTVGDIMTKWGPYVALVGAVLPPSLVTYQAIQQRRLELAGPTKPAEVERPAPERSHPQEGVRL